MKFFCIGDAETVRGFRLAGIEGKIVNASSEAAAALEQAVAQPDCGILVITQKVAAGIRPQVETIRWQRAHPLVVEIPGPEGPQAGRKSLRQFVQEAVGMRLG